MSVNADPDNNPVNIRILEDLYENIFDHLEGDKGILVKCSTASKVFLKPCRKVLFRRIVVGEIVAGTKFTGFQRFLQDHPAHCRLIRHLGFSRGPLPPMHGSYLPDMTPSQVWYIVRLLPNLRELVFQNISFWGEGPPGFNVPPVQISRLEFRSCIAPNAVFRRFLRLFTIGELCIGPLLTHGESAADLSYAPIIVRSLVLFVRLPPSLVDVMLSADSCENLYAYASSTQEFQIIGRFMERSYTKLKEITLDVRSGLVKLGEQRWFRAPNGYSYISLQISIGLGFVSILVLP